MLQRLPLHLLRYGFWALLLAVTTLSLLPTTYLPAQVFSIWDKAQHALAFAALATCALLAYPQQRHARHVLPGLLLYGGAIELAQAATGWRYGEWNDWLADALGLTAGAGVAWGLRRLSRQPRHTPFS